MISHDTSKVMTTVSSAIRVTLYIAINIKWVNHNDMTFFRPKVEVKFQRKSRQMNFKLQVMVLLR